MGKRQSLQQIVLGKLDSDMQKNEPGPLSYTIYKNKFKMDEGPKCEKGNQIKIKLLGLQQNSPETFFQRRHADDR